MFFNRGIAGKADDISQLVAKKNFARAIDLLKTQLAKDARSISTRQQLADVYVQAGQGREAVRILDQLADEFAKDGFAAKAIAVLKKIQRIDPGRTDIDDKLAGLVQNREQEVSRRQMLRTPPRLSRPAAETVEEDRPFVPESPFTTPSRSGARADERADDYVEIEFPVAAPVTADQEYLERAEIVKTPLFGDFSKEELVAVIRGLRLLTFEAGDILVSEGEPGDSLFVVTTGTVKAFVKNRIGHDGKVRELSDGDFFGEISILTGKARTATITAATPCELLELDRQALESITQTHPHVQQVLQSFCSMRANSTVESIIRSTSTQRN